MVQIACCKMLVAAKEENYMKQQKIEFENLKI